MSGQTVKAGKEQIVSEQGGRKIINWRAKNMCYNCGCGKLDDNMGNPKNITNKTFEEAGRASGQKTEEAKRNAYEALKKEVEKKK